MSKRRSEQRRPAVENLEGRQLTAAMAGMLMTVDAVEVGQSGETDQEAAARGAKPATGKVKMQDFHFVQQVNKASPSL